MPSPATHSAPSLPERLGRIVAGLRRDLAFQAGRDRALAPLVLLLWNRLSRLLARVGAACAQAERGIARSPTTQPRQGPAPPRDPLPRQLGWLIHRVPSCAAYGEHLRLLLDDPEVQLLLATAPPLRRLLRPLWRMLRDEPAPNVLRTAPARQSTSRPRDSRLRAQAALATAAESRPIRSAPPGLSPKLA